MLPGGDERAGQPGWVLRAHQFLAHDDGVRSRPGVAEQVARATADGYTLLVIGANNPINTTLYDKLGFDLLRDFAPVAGIYRVFQVMVVNPTFPAPTMARATGG